MHFVEWFIALRYLFSRERRVLVSANTLISVAGVAVGVAVLVVTAGVMDGAISLLFGKITDLYPHVSIARVDEKGEPTTVDPELAAQFRKEPRVQFATPVLSRPTMLQPRSGIEAQKDMVQLMAVDELGSGTLYTFNGKLGEKQFSLKDNEILLGKPMAETLRTTAGSDVILYPFNLKATANSLRLRPFKVAVMDPYETGYYEFDKGIAFVSPALFRRMYGIENGVDYIHIKLKDPYAVDAFVASLDLPPDYQVTTWKQQDADFFAALKFQKYMLVIILMLIVVVAAFNIIGTLVLMVFDKTREIGILKATGMRQATIARIFLLDGMLIGLSGTLAGVVLGLLFSEGLRLYHFPMPAAVYNFATLPVINRPESIAVIVVCALAICTGAALLPAIQASRLNPVEALRYE